MYWWYIVTLSLFHMLCHSQTRIVKHRPKNPWCLYVINILWANWKRSLVKYSRLLYLHCVIWRGAGGGEGVFFCFFCSFLSILPIYVFFWGYFFLKSWFFFRVDIPWLMTWFVWIVPWWLVLVLCANLAGLALVNHPSPARYEGTNLALSVVQSSADLSRGKANNKSKTLGENRGLG